MASAPPAERPAIARRYVRLLRDHIDKENGVLFPMADAVLDERAQEPLASQFHAAAIEQGRDGDPALAQAAVERLRSAIGQPAGHAIA
jgi:hemerythrin-like domain-containing protein